MSNYGIGCGGQIFLSGSSGLPGEGQQSHNDEICSTDIYNSEIYLTATFGHLGPIKSRISYWTKISGLERNRRCRNNDKKPWLYLPNAYIHGI